MRLLNLGAWSYDAFAEVWFCYESLRACLHVCDATENLVLFVHSCIFLTACITCIPSQLSIGVSALLFSTRVQHAFLYSLSASVAAAELILRSQALHTKCCDRAASKQQLRQDSSVRSALPSEEVFALRSCSWDITAACSPNLTKQLCFSLLN